MYAIVVTKDVAKAERIIRQFSRRVQVSHTRSIEFLYSRWPVNRKVCMKCVEGKWHGICSAQLQEICPADKAAEDALIGLRALEYARVKGAKLVFPAP